MAKKNKTEATVNANNLRSAGFAEFEANHTFTAESKLCEFTRAAIQAGLTNEEIVEIGTDIYGEGKIKLNCVNWYRSSDPVLNPGKERYRATGAKSIEVRNKVTGYYNDLDEAGKANFVNELVNAIGVEKLIETTKVDILKSVAPAELFPVAVKKEKKVLTDVEKLMKKQEAAEKKAAKLAAELEAMKAAEAEAPVDAEV